jgi:hypothetical protein
MRDRRWTTVLTKWESRICTRVGQERFAFATRMRCDPGLGPSPTSDKFHIRGAHCEYAASLILNLSWRPAIGELNNCDVGGVVEVRSTDIPHGRLIVKPADQDGAPYVLIVCLPGQPYLLAGWTFGREAKTFQLNTAHGDPAHFVPQGALRDNNELVAWLAHQRLKQSEDHQRD